MGYTKKWTPPTIPLRDDLPAWKTLFNDLHDNLITAGLVQTGTSGQLDIDGVSTLPVDGTFAGFIEYAFNDALQSEAPIVIKLEFGCGWEGLYTYNGGASIRTRTPRIRVTVLFNAATIATFACPQDYTGILPYSQSNSQLINAGTSYISHDKSKGWLGVCYGEGSRNKPFSNSAGSYYGATLTLFVQRQLDSNGIPTSNGVAVYYPTKNGNSAGNLWDVGVLELSISGYSNGSIVMSRSDMAPRIGRDGFAGGVDSVLLEPIYFPTNPPTPFPYLYSYRNTVILAGTEFEFNSVIGEPLNFIAIGNETCISVDSVEGQRAGIAMLFE